MKTLLLAVMIALGIAVPAYSADQSITHVVIVWVKEDVSEQQISDIIDKTKALSEIEVVRALKVGAPVPSDRKTVDDSFSFAMSLEFKSSADMQKYVEHEIHQAYVKEVLAPALKKYVVYDF